MVKLFGNCSGMTSHLTLLINDNSILRCTVYDIKKSDCGDVYIG